MRSKELNRAIMNHIPRDRTVPQSLVSAKNVYHLLQALRRLLVVYRHISGVL